MSKSRCLNMNMALLLRNGRVWTGTPALPEAEAIGIVGDRVVAVGDAARVRAALGQNAEEIDLGGRRVVPGFIDNHVHFLSGGEHLLGLDLSSADSPDDFVRRVFAAVEAHRTATVPPRGGWITGGRWDNARWPGGQWPHRRLIDPFSADVPIFLRRADGHMALANTCALRLTGITRDTASPPGGSIDRDTDGEPTGILRETAMALVETRIPHSTPVEKERAIRAALAHAAALGVTGVNDFESPEVLPIYRALEAADKLTCRITYWHGIRQWEEAARLHRCGEFSGGFLRLGGVKAFMDGSLGSRTALMFTPFADEQGNCGLAAEGVEDGTLEQQIRAADGAGLQVAVHAIGDRANALTLDIVERVIRDHGARDRRLRIEHAQHLRAEDFPRFARLGVIASVQPPHILLDAPVVDRALGPERAARTYAFRTFLKVGAHLTFGTDWPVTPLAPLAGIQAAVTRAPLDGSQPEGWFPEQRLTVAEALHAYTVENAYAEFQEQTKGSLAPGKLADLVVLSDDILNLPPERIRDAFVTMTIVGGRIVYRAGGW